MSTYVKKGPKGELTGDFFKGIFLGMAEVEDRSVFRLEVEKSVFHRILVAPGSPAKPAFLLPLSTPPGWVLIDRSGRHFGTILNYLRDGSVPLPESTRELGELLGEARYYLVQGLIEDCQLALQVRVSGSHPMPMSPGELSKQLDTRTLKKEREGRGIWGIVQRRCLWPGCD